MAIVYYGQLTLVKAGMDRILRLNEFFVEGGKQHISHVLLHISEPTTPEEIAKGYFFAVCEINHAEPKYFSRIKDLIDRAGNDYYETPDTTDKNALELVLEKLNQEALTLVDNDLELHCIIGAIRQPEIMFTYYGKPHVLVFYKNPQGIYQSMDLVEAGSAGEHPKQLFSHIVQGKISPNDYLFAGTPHISEYFSSDRLQKIITSRPAVQSAQHIERVLSEIKNGHSFGGLIIHIDRADAGPVPIRKTSVVKGASSRSLHSLFNREESTANTLSPSLFPRLKSFLKREPTEEEKDVPSAEPKIYQPAEINAAHVSQRQTNRGRETKIIAISKIKALAIFLWKVLQFIGKSLAFVFILIYSLLYGIFRHGVLLIFAITNYQNRRQHILEIWRKQWHSYKENIRRLPLITKVLFIASILLAAGIGGSITIVRYRQAEAAHEKRFKEIIQKIQNKKDAVESALIYKDDEAAQTEFASATTLLKDLECLSKEEKTTCASLQGQFDDLAITIRKIVNINPELLFEWATESQLMNLVKVNTKLIGLSDSTSTLQIFDLLSRENKSVYPEGKISGFIKANAPKENDYVVLNTVQKNFISFDPLNFTTKLITVAFPNEQVAIADFLIYNRRLYTLDALNNQVYKHDSLKNGFDKGKEWIKDETLVKDGQELTIDGDMFVLKDNGTIIKFTAGISQPFSVVGLDQSIGKNASLWTYTDLAHLYVLDPENKRLIILEKDGRIKAQLMSETFIRPTGLAVDPANGVAYILDSNRLLKITLPQ